MAETKDVGRPPKVTPEERKEIFEAYKLYIEREPDPTTVGFCAWDPVAKKYWITRDNIKDWSEFSPLQKVAVEKQEAYLTKGAVQGTLNSTFSIFRLKQPQHGWRDQPVEEVQPLQVQFMNKVPKVPNTESDTLPSQSETSGESA